jgi:hypothetical protein
MEAALPPPEEEKSVKTKIGAGRAEHERNDYVQKTSLRMPESIPEADAGHLRQAALALPAMMSPLSITLGVALVLVGIADLLATVIWINAGQGWVTGFVGSSIWSGALRLHDPGSDRSHRLLSAVGPLILVVTVALWYLFVVAGWTLFFVPQSFSEPVDLWGRVGFAFGSVVGLSVDLTLASPLWETAATVARFTGIWIATLGLAFLIPIVGAVAQRRQLAASIHSVGTDPEEILALERESAEGFLNLHMLAWIPELTLTTERHVTYPVLHYFHSPSRVSALPAAVTMAAILLDQDFPPDSKVDRSVTQPLGNAIRHLLDTLHKGYPGEDEDTVTDKDEAAVSRSELEEYLRRDGWDWQTLGLDPSRP